ncbi:MAG TPA: hypothetical protein VJ550_12385 [Geomonas sp.]|nr:hypothetical protein [Geomonas sp.]
MSPSRFHAYNQKTRNGLAGSSKLKESNPALMSSYEATSDKHDSMYHQASYGSKLDIAERDRLQSELVDLLDEIASLLESLAVRSPDVLLTSGFDLAKERRNRTRSKAALAVTEEFNPSNAEQPST